MSAVKASASKACFQVRGIRDLSKINAIKQKILKGHAPPTPVMPELGKMTSSRPAWTAQADHLRIGLDWKKQPGGCQNMLSGRCFGNGSKIMPGIDRALSVALPPKAPMTL